MIVVAAIVSLLLGGALAARATTPLGLLNFVVLQWFGVRLTACCDTAGPDAARGRWWSAAAPTGGRVWWRFTRWVWPLTGWWSSYRPRRQTGGAA
jgi:hypothetical protein